MPIPAPPAPEAPKEVGIAPPPAPHQTRTLTIQQVMATTEQVLGAVIGIGGYLMSDSMVGSHKELVMVIGAAVHIAGVIQHIVAAHAFLGATDNA
jgi:hypothetical protein